MHSWSSHPQVNVSAEEKSIRVLGCSPSSPPQGASPPALALGTEHSPEAQSLPGDLWNSRGAGAVHLFCIYCLSLDSYYTALPSAEGKISLFHLVCFLE